MKEPYKYRNYFEALADGEDEAQEEGSPASQASGQEEKATTPLLLVDVESEGPSAPAPVATRTSVPKLEISNDIDLIDLNLIDLSAETAPLKFQYTHSGYHATPQSILDLPTPTLQPQDSPPLRNNSAQTPHKEDVLIGEWDCIFPTLQQSPHQPSDMPSTDPSVSEMGRTTALSQNSQGSHQKQAPNAWSVVGTPHKAKPPKQSISRTPLVPVHNVNKWPLSASNAKPDAAPNRKSPKPTNQYNANPKNMANGTHLHKAAGLSAAPRSMATDKASQPRAANPLHIGGQGQQGQSTATAQRVRRPARIRPTHHMFVADTAAQAAWRRGEPPRRRFRLPPNFDPLGPKKASGNGVPPSLPQLEQIARLTSTHIVPKFVRGSRDTVEVSIWGTDPQIQLALAEIKAWIKETHPDDNKGGWAKIPSLNERQKKAIEKRLNSEAKRQRYRKAPPEFEPFEFEVEIAWPVTRQRPQDILGNSFEAFDPIRMDCFVYITVRQPGDRPNLMVRIQGNDRDQVLEAEARVAGTYQQILAREFEPPQWFLIKSADDADLRHKIILAPYRGIKVLNAQLEGEAVGMMPLYAGPPLDDSEMSERKDIVEKADVDTVVAGSQEVEARNLHILEAVTLTTLNMLPYLRANLQMRARLGTFVLTKYRAPKFGEFDLEDFEEMLTDFVREEDEMEAHVTQELGDRILEGQALGRIRQATHLLTSENAWSSDLHEVKPSYSGGFVVGNPDPKDGSGDLRLEVEFVETADAYESTFRRWAKLDHGRDDLTTVMEVDLVDLAAGSTYQLAITSSNVADESRLPGPYRNFAYSVNLNLAEAQKAVNSRHFIQFFNYAGVPIKSMHQKKAWHFTMVDSEYIVEVASVQKFEFSADSTKVKPYEVRWNVSLHHPQWDMSLGGNANIGTGQKANWAPREPNFFPPDKSSLEQDAAADPTEEPKILYAGIGFETLLRKLEAVERIVRGQEVQITHK